MSQLLRCEDKTSLVDMEGKRYITTGITGSSSAGRASAASLVDMLFNRAEISKILRFKEGKIDL
jgi:hypothetical protein